MPIEHNTIEITVVLADDHEVVRAGLKRLLVVDKQIKVLDEAENGQDAVNLVEYYRPDVVLLDIQMPLMNGIDAAKEIKNRFPEIFVIMLTAYEDSFHLEKAIAAGADGYLSKDISAKELAKSIHTVLRNERVFSKSIIKLLQYKYIPESAYDATPVVITKREQQILNLVASGKTSSKIAERLCISVRTVESHRYNIMQKLGINNTAGLVRYAVINTNFLNTGNIS